MGSNQPHTAIQTLLKCDKLDEAMAILETSQPNDTSAHFELFHLLATYILKNKRYEKCQVLWTLMPKSFTGFDLLHLIKTHIPEPSDSLLGVTNTNELTISTVLPQLMKMVEQQIAKEENSGIKS
jgi:hypothetical protein